MTKARSFFIESILLKDRALPLCKSCEQRLGLQTKALILGCFLSIFLATPSRADLPNDVLDRDYENCLDGDKDPARTTYCACIRNGMKEWDVNTYAEAAMQGLSPSSNPDTLLSGKIGDLAKQCLSQALR